MKIGYLRLLMLLSEIALGTYLAIHQGIGFLWAFFAIYGAGVFTSLTLNAINKTLDTDF